MHNKTVDETTNGTGRINSFTLKEIQELDAGCKWTIDGKTFPFQCQGIRVPTLKEVFEAFPETRMVIEIKQTKPSIVKPLADLIRDYKMTEKVLVASFYHRALKEFRRECPEVATSASTLELFKFLIGNTLFKGLAKVPAIDAVQVGIRFFNIPIPFINRRTIQAARDMNIPIQAWTVNGWDDMKKMISAGVDGIITDNPSELLRTLNRHKKQISK